MRKRLAIMLCLAVLPGFAAAGDGAAAFEKMKSLVGTWTFEAMGEHQTVNYKLTGAGSALVETLFPGSPHEMVSVIHLDGDELLLTHYCASGNQPLLKLSTFSDDTATFTFVRGTNMKPEDNHMHGASFKFMEKDNVSVTWIAFAEGKEAMKMEFDMSRAK